MSHGVDYIVKTLADKKGGVEASVQALESNIQGISRVLSTKIKPEKEFMTSSGAVVKLQDEPEYSSLPSVVRYGVDSSNVMPMNLEIDSKPVPLFDPLDLLSRTVAAVCTLGSGCSLGPEGPCVEIGAGVSRMLSGTNSSLRERHHLLLAGVAGGVAAGFNAPIAGVFFAIECGNRFLTKNGIVLSSTAKGDDIEDGPRADIAAIVLSATVAALVVQFSSKEATLSIQGNVYSMVSPLFEFPLYLGLGILCGAISVLFANMRDFFKDFFQGKQQIFAGDNSILNGSIGRFFADLPAHYKPLLGGLICGIVAVFYPQTLFVGYAILDELLAGRFPFGLSLIFQLLFLKMFLTSFSLGSGLVGGTFAPALFFGAAAGTAYHNLLQSAVQVLTQLASSSGQIPLADTMSHFLVLAGAPAYATVGAAATLGALFRAPLTASMLMFEVTQNHDIILPVLASTGVAGLFAEIICRPRRQGK